MCIGPAVATDLQGCYEIPAVPPEQEGFKYLISADADGYGPTEREKISPIAGSAKVVEVKTLIMQPANMSISGVVVDAKGAPSAGVPVFSEGPRGSATKGQPEGETVTDANGQFVFNRVCKGPLRLQAGYMSHTGGAGFLDAEGGDKNVKVILGQSGVHIGDASLVGKNLPDLKELNLDVKIEQIKDKMILLCFWEMDQRPSRNCVQRLKGRATLLANKGVYVVLVHASEVKEQRLNEWMKKNEIDLPAARIKDNINEVRQRWAVCNLPWLILTDRKHIVAAEGFSLSELDERIKAITER